VRFIDIKKADEIDTRISAFLDGMKQSAYKIDRKVRISSNSNFEKVIKKCIVGVFI
jgi:hypothetical protein